MASKDVVDKPLQKLSGSVTVMRTIEGWMTFVNNFNIFVKKIGYFRHVSFTDFD